MSLGREALRTGIRLLAPPGLMIYIFYKFWLQAKDQSWFINLIASYRKLYRKLRSTESQKEQDKPRDTDHDTDPD